MRKMEMIREKQHWLKCFILGIGVCLAMVCYINVYAADLPALEEDPMAYAAYEQRYEQRQRAAFGEQIIHNERFDGTTVRYGIDVSYYQGEIDWEAVKESGVEFVMVRVGYRGLTSGKLYEDSQFKNYMNGAIEAGLRVGVYFFSQAISEAEAVEEADYVLERIKNYNITMPVAIDYEYGGDGSRLYAADLSIEMKTAVCDDFCKQVAVNEYKPMVYANKNMLENQMDGLTLGKTYAIWLAQYGQKATYANKYSFWQYTSDGKVKGIAGRVDMNVWYDNSDMILVGNENAEKYTRQLYLAFLGREPDAPGLYTCIQSLTEGEMTASRLALTISESDEFKKRNYTNEEFIAVVYQGMLGRKAGEDEIKGMASYLEKGMSKRYILSLVSGSQEFARCCEQLEIEQGIVRTTENRDKNVNYTAYVMRCYEKLLGRRGDESGLNTWTGSIASGGGGAYVIRVLTESQEFAEKKYSDGEYVELLYQSMLNRSSDSSGKSAWEEVLEKGGSRLSVIAGFCDSEEFKELCRKYNMNTGEIVLQEPRDKNINLTGFVSRCYKTALVRNPDADGLNNWCRQLLAGAFSPAEVAFGFVFSKEARERYASDEAFVDMLYQLCFGRNSDEAGKRNWLNQLQAGASRESVFGGFADSLEFQAIVRRYGL